MEKKIRLFGIKNTYTICYFHCSRVKDLFEIENDTYMGEMKEGTLGGFGEVD